MSFSSFFVFIFIFFLILKKIFLIFLLLKIALRIAYEGYLINLIFSVLFKY